MNKTILILGASSEIGCSLLTTLIEENKEHKFLCHYHSSKEKLIEIQNKYPKSIELIQANLNADNEINHLSETVLNNFPVPDNIIFLASKPMTYTRFKDIVWEDFQDNLNIQLKSTVLILNKFLPLMAKRKSGKVIFLLSSVTNGIPPANLSPYITSKYATLGLLKSLSSDYVSKNIQINALSPSMIETKFLNNIPEKIVEIAAATHPLKRNACIQDVVPMISFLMSEKSDFITGQNIPINGGLYF